MIGSFTLGFVLGVLQIGSVMWRTLIVIEGDWLLTWVPSVIITITYFVGITFIVSNNIPGYLGYALGGSAAVSYLAWKEKHKRNLGQDEEELTE